MLMYFHRLLATRSKMRLTVVVERKRKRLILYTYQRSRQYATIQVSRQQCHILFDGGYYLHGLEQVAEIAVRFMPIGSGGLCETVG